MAVQTPTIDLTKPAGGEPVQVLILNENWDKVDAAVKALQDRSAKLEAPNGTQFSRDAAYNTPTTEAPLPWNSSTLDAGDWNHTNGTFTCVRAGVYFVSYQVSIPPGSATLVTVGIRRNGAILSQGYANRNTTESRTVNITGLQAFAIGDTLAAVIVGSAATGLDVTFNRTNISIFRVRNL